ncbi:MAG TPA: membrane protein insertase YidC [Thermoanaerobaculia bacterium]|nr:membrane protein insertase YidC [Thermoanaerobaculia bacterium]
MEKRLLLAAGLSLGILIAWEWLVPKPPKPAATASSSVPAAATTAPGAPTTQASGAQAPAAAAASTVPAQELHPESAGEETTTELENDLFKATFTNRGAVLRSFVLKHYTDEQQRPLELVRALPPDLPRPMALDFDKNEDTTKAVSAALFVVEHDSPRHVVFRYADTKVSVVKEFQISDGYLFQTKIAVTGPAFHMILGPGLGNPPETERRSRYVMPASAILSTTDGLKLIRPEKATAGETWTIPAKGFAGMEDNYFLQVLVPNAAAPARLFTFAVPHPGADKPSMDIAVGVGSDRSLEGSLYVGPKDVAILESYGISLERTVDFGWYAILARPLLWLLKKSYGFVGNWGLAILVVTFLIRLALFPLTAKSYVSMKKMQKLAPKMNAIRDKYKKARSDAAQRQKMNAELMALYQAEGYNPMSGCLPMVLQLPILVAFYNVLSKTIELRHAPFVLWIRDLSAVDTSYVLVILMIISMYLQQAMTPSTMDPAQKKIFMFMPVFMGFLFKDMPAGLVLYWLFSNLLTIAQQMIMNRMVKEDDSAPPAKSARLKAARSVEAKR